MRWRQSEFGPADVFVGSVFVPGGSSVLCCSHRSGGRAGRMTQRKRYAPGSVAGSTSIRCRKRPGVPVFFFAHERVFVGLNVHFLIQFCTVPVSESESAPLTPARRLRAMIARITLCKLRQCSIYRKERDIMKAFLILEDGTVLTGESFGAQQGGHQ